ncbi:type I-E CRISPR-associated protein Cse1/CasA [Tessaracoccus sp. OH4464_COT-324]|uniref:type I-E CRISPR-associated protein Cse1/CasA n=1 Tax=Tessaracoccus sp. OH4464_COT-324 TaxID=2491059 RepID=UPI000F62E02F|nr:type I-E CRISPR-associated protein Cse1/CasA [Tessaracoccus sp. OH4464_COT-324]RRD45912.1 type I-E CRISPR-associated protein Cse1/CasA [Tessaracoccus sp. OH4464_COT-324]
MSYNLLDEAWIPVLLKDRAAAQLSLLDVFRQSPLVRRICAELPTQSFAILRLLLAICHDAVGFHDEDDIAEALENGLDVERIVDYLEQHRGRFDLFDPQTPFYQVATLRTAKDEHSGLEKLISDVPNGTQFLTVRSGEAVERISAAEAAQWLVHCHAFDPSGIRSGAVGDPEVKGGRGYPIGPGWCGQIGGVVLHGDSLARTLVLNLVPTEGKPSDRPVWVLDPQTEQRKIEPTVPGPVSLLTWQSRRIRLVGDRDGVTGLVLAQGDKMTPQNRHDVEYMTAWRYSKPQSKKFGIDVYMPLKHDPARSGWRGLPAILSTPKVEDGKELTRRPRIVDSIGDISSFGDEDLEYSVGIELVGMDYGPQEATVAELVHDELDVRASLLGKQAVHVRAAVQDATDMADNCIWALGRLASSLAEAAGDFDGLDGARDRATLNAWAAIDPAARAWLSRLHAESVIVDALREWQKELGRILSEQAALLLENCPPQSVVGRKTKRGYVSAGIAEARFWAAIRKELTLAYPPTGEEENKNE